MNEDKSARYHRLTRRARGMSLLWSATLLTTLLVSPGARLLRDAAAHTAAWSEAPNRCLPALTVAVFVTLLALLHACGSMPVAYYLEHALDSRYRLSTETAAQWVRMRLKGGVVGFAAVQAEAGVLFLAVRTWPEGWWLPAGLAFAVLTLGAAKLGPLVLSLASRIEPLQRDTLQRRLAGLARRAGTPVLGVYQWNLSGTTRRANASLVGLGRTCRVLLSDTLLADYSDDEVEVIVAHELAHHVHKDVGKTVALKTVMGWVAFFAAERALRLGGGLAGLSGPADVAGLPFLLLAFGTLWVAVSPAMNALSRAQERRADRFALSLTGNPDAFTSAMRRLARQNLAEERPSPLARALFSSHPPVAERLGMARTADSRQLLAISPRPTAVSGDSVPGTLRS